MDANLVAAWEAAYKARTYNLKANTAAETRASIIEKEAASFEALSLALEGPSDTAARIIAVQATAEDSNERLRDLQRESTEQNRRSRNCTHSSWRGSYRTAWRTSRI